MSVAYGQGFCKTKPLDAGETCVMTADVQSTSMGMMTCCRHFKQAICKHIEALKPAGL